MRCGVTEQRSMCYSYGGVGDSLSLLRGPWPAICMSTNDCVRLHLPFLYEYTAGVRECVVFLSRERVVIHRGEGTTAAV